jgi:hypothetical protein
MTRNSLADPRFSSFVAIPKILRISTIICVIMSVIAVVGATSVYVSSRMKKTSNAFEELCENVFTRCNIIGRLEGLQGENDLPREIDGILA